MSIDAIAALLGHKTLAMTMIYARVADNTVAEEYFNVTEKVEALHGQPQRLPHGEEGSEMRKLRAEMHRRTLGNGHCARPVDTDCHFESICEGCTFFITTIEFRPRLSLDAPLIVDVVRRVLGQMPCAAGSLVLSRDQTVAQERASARCEHRMS